MDAAELPREAAYFRWRTEGKVGPGERNGLLERNGFSENAADRIASTGSSKTRAFFFFFFLFFWHARLRLLTAKRVCIRGHESFSCIIYYFQQRHSSGLKNNIPGEKEMSYVLSLFFSSIFENYEISLEFLSFSSRFKSICCSIMREIVKLKYEKVYIYMYIF